MVVHCNAVRDDLVSHYGVLQQRIQVVPMGSVLRLIASADNDDGQRRRSQLAMPQRYAIYPAQSWPHKNHPRLIDAVAQLRDRGIDVPIVCPGATLDVDRLRAHARDVGVADLVFTPGRVSDVDLLALYQGAHCLVFPSTYEGFGLPIVEAFDVDIPVVCSDIAALVEVAGGAAQLVDPFDVESIASGMATVWQDEAVAGELSDSGRRRLTRYTWEETGRAYRRIYDQVAKRELVR